MLWLLINTPSRGDGRTVSAHKTVEPGAISPSSGSRDGNNLNFDIDIKDNKGLTPLYHAAANGQWDSTVPWLLKKGANINMTYTFKFDPRSHWSIWTLLAECCRLGRYQDARWLVHLGADVTIPLHVENTPENQPETLHNMEGNGKEPIPILHLCCMRNRTRLGTRHVHPMRSGLINALINAGALIDGRWGPLELTPLHVAAVDGVEWAVRALLKAGAHVNSEFHRPHIVSTACTIST